MESIKSSELQVVISPAGAEMQSICDVKTEREYFWQGDPKYWGGRSPILFPIVGGMWNGECRIEGKTYRIPKHGFVRLREWEVISREENTVTCACESIPEELEVYPFKYRVEAKFSVVGRKVEVAYTVFNLDDKKMWFQLGGHPAFILPDFKEGTPISGYLKFEGDVHSLVRAGEQGCIEMERAGRPQRYPIPWSNKDKDLVNVCVDTFANEALIFDQHQLKAATLLDTTADAPKPIARVESTAPAWLFWAPQGVHSPFVCIEPWYGLCDDQHFAGDINERSYINHLEPGEIWQGGYSIDIF